ncbi:uncharacterized protein HRG_11921 [Hirsutella rhossiliensis]|uniref:Uncharacterized protein n=1 Tax=Hirsutella rhossiliensis TaxID=111463 RepID=A0A9P8SCL6_9HYPO|nr:uncharacterized protein HRG_11921 [Hirsutella rhossiliensis]KAH0957019.1 hypothetical protein HRG_11921 [Hirsutella rhossiliensis]
MKKIVDTGPRDTIAGRLEDMFTDVNQQSDRCVIQISDGSFGTIAGDAALRLDLGMRLMAAFRMYQDLPTDAQKKDRLAKARMKPDEAIAEHALLAARKPGRFRYANREQRIQQVVDVFATAVPMSTPKHRSMRIPACASSLQTDTEYPTIWITNAINPAVPSEAGRSGRIGSDRAALVVHQKVGVFGLLRQPPSTQGCTADRDATNRDVSMTDRTSPPLELDAPHDDSHRADDQRSTLQLLRRDIENERSKLDQLNALLAAAQAKIEDKETLLGMLARQEEEQHAKIEETETLLGLLATQEEENTPSCDSWKRCSRSNRKTGSLDTKGCISSRDLILATKFGKSLYVKSTHYLPSDCQGAAFILQCIMSRRHNFMARAWHPFRKGYAVEERQEKNVDAFVFAAKVTKASKCLAVLRPVRAGLSRQQRVGIRGNSHTPSKDY